MSLHRLDDGLYRLTLPLPFHGLGAVHAYLLRDAGGWTVVDTGLNTPDARAVWQAAFRELDIGPGGLSRILLTHVHPDHYGMAGWLQAQAREAGRAVPVRTSAREQVLAALYFPDGPTADREAALDAFFARCGLPPQERALSEQMMGWLRRATRPAPIFGPPLAGGDTVEAAGRCFRVVETPGHSDGHLTLFDPEDGLFLAGDHVLPEITPNIGLWPATEPDPLGRYLASLEALARLPVRRVLPGHGPVFTDWTGRLDAIARHHRDRLDAMLDAIGRGATVAEVTAVSFDLKTLRPDQQRFAVTETLAHLEYLVRDGRLARSDDAVWRYAPRAA